MKDPFQLNQYAELMGLGIEIAASMVLPIAVGVYVDYRFESTPWGVLIGVFLGLVSMVLKLYKVVVISDHTSKRQPKDHKIK